LRRLFEPCAKENEIDAAKCRPFSWVNADGKIATKKTRLIHHSEKVLADNDQKLVPGTITSNATLQVRK